MALVSLELVFPELFHLFQVLFVLGQQFFSLDLQLLDFILKRFNFFFVLRYFFIFLFCLRWDWSILLVELTYEVGTLWALPDQR
mmetsp:Transcript_42796/g.41139  ORF Transcript_42796/g.41139 Transcript_42796/m.41139 type:complete len:84 (-) Transcript_42796:324-575(-)